MLDLTIKFESYKPVTRSIQAAIGLARQRNFKVKSIVDFKRQTKMPVTVISGPHVHKKSRTQYKMDWYRGLFVIDLRRREHPRVGTANSVTYKKELLDTLHLDEGFQVSFSYASTGIITLD